MITREVKEGWGSHFTAGGGEEQFHNSRVLKKQLKVSQIYHVPLDRIDFIS